MSCMVSPASATAAVAASTQMPMSESSGRSWKLVSPVPEMTAVVAMSPSS